jgi:hypothetical protein
MKRTCISLLLVAAVGASQAGTVYRDRPMPIPSGAPCTVPFNGIHINANMLRDAFLNLVTKTCGSHP